MSLLTGHKGLGLKIACLAGHGVLQGNDRRFIAKPATFACTCWLQWSY